jgi:hypothetical protein
LEEGGWRVTDVFEILQNSDRTLFSPDDQRVWAYPLPSGLQEFELGQSDLPEEAVRVVGDTLELSAPIPPGGRFLLVRYRVPGEELELPAPGRTVRAEVFLREPNPPAEFPPLALEGPVEMDPGNVFRRYGGQELQDTRIRGRLVPASRQIRAEWFGFLLAGLLAAAAVFAIRSRSAGTTVPTGPEPGGRGEVLRVLAELDEAYEAQTSPSPQREAEYVRRRNELIAQLRSLS